MLAPDVSVCQLYAIQDNQADDSQFFTINYSEIGDAINALGEEHANAAIEGMDVDPISGAFFISSAHQGSQNSQLFVLHPHSGEMFLVGDIRDADGSGYKGVASLSFHPDGTLWGFATEGPAYRRGIITIDPSTGIATLIHQSTRNIEGIAWTPDGSTLWLAAENHLKTYTLGGSIELAYWASELPGGPIEGLEFRPDGLLLMGIHHGNDLNIYAFDVEAGEVVFADGFDTLRNDDHGVVMAVGAETVPEPTTITFNEVYPENSTPAHLDFGGHAFRLNAYNDEGDFIADLTLLLLPFIMEKMILLT